jgi:hypothetical protein
LQQQEAAGAEQSSGNDSAGTKNDTRLQRVSLNLYFLAYRADFQ